MELKLVDSKRMKRGTRRPRLDIMSIGKPYSLIPWFIHPVLPGETLKRAYAQITAVSDPVVSKFLGAHMDYFMFYIKHSQLSTIASNLIAMHVDNGNLTSAVQAAAEQPFFHPAGGINYTELAYNEIVKWYFRDADEPLTPASGLINGYQPIRVQRTGWWNSIKKEATNPTRDEELPGEDQEFPPSAPDNLATHFEQWQRMRALGYTDATYEDYLRSHGVNIPQQHDEELMRPELVRHVQEWAFPVNTVEPSTGVPTSAHVFRSSATADKDRYFKEPGFLVGVWAYRPKVFLGNITGSMAHFMNSAQDWLPATLQDLPFASLKEFATATGPLPLSFSDDYWIDLRDYLLHGEQLWNDRLNIHNPVALPTNTANSKYITEGEANVIFTNLEGAGRMRMEGVVSFDIASPIAKDTTPN